MAREPRKDQTGVDRGRRLISFIAIALILVGQIVLIPTRDAAAVPLMFLLTTLGVLLFLWGRVYHRTQLDTFLARRLTLPTSYAWIATSLVLSVIAAVGMVLFEKYDYTVYFPILTLWIGCAGSYLLAFAQKISFPADWKHWISAHWQELASIGLITIVAAVLRFYKLGEIPRVVNGDEGWIGTTALSTVRNPYANPFALWENFGALYLQAVNFLFKWLGVSAFTLRLLPAIGGSLAIPAVYLLGRQISNHRVGLVAAFLIAFSHTQIHFSRTAAVAYIHSTWLVPFELYFLLSGLEKRRTWRAAVAGVLLGFHFSIYLTAQIITALVLVYMLLMMIILRSQLKDFLRVMSAFWGGLIVMLIPQAVNFSRHPNEYFSRLSMDGTFQSGWLANTMANTGQSAFRILSERVLHAFLSLIYYPAFDFYGSSIPMLTLFTAALFLLGLGLSLWKTASPGYLLLNGYFWAATVAVGVFSIPPSADAYRMLIALPAALIMAAFALDYMLVALGMGWEHWKKGYATIVSAVLISVLIFNIWVYFFDFAGRCRYGSDNPQTRFDSYLGSYLRTTPVEVSIFLLSDNAFSYGTNLTVDFLSNKRAVTNFPDPVDTLVPVSGDIVIANPNRVEELAAWARQHPGGEFHQESDCENKILLVYKLP